MSFAQMPDNRWRIATERVKWSTQYQKKHGIMTDRAKLDAPLLDRMQRIAKRAYRALDLNGYARIDLRMDEEGRIYVLEANPNPNMAYGEDFAESAEASGISLRAAARAHHRARPALGAGPHRIDRAQYTRALHQPVHVRDETAR